MVNHPNRKRLKTASWCDCNEAALKEALLPAAKGKLTPNEAYRLIYYAARSMRQGLSLSWADYERIIEEVFGKAPDALITPEFNQLIENRLKERGLKSSSTPS